MGAGKCLASMCMCRSQGSWQESVVPLFRMDPGTLKLSLSDLAGGVSAHRGHTAEWGVNQGHRRPCVPGHAGAPCCGVPPFHKQALTQEFPRLGPALCYSSGPPSGSVSVMSCLQSRARRGPRSSVHLLPSTTRRYPHADSVPLSFLPVCCSVSGQGVVFFCSS